jgi:6-phosphogluconate dehydrogenase
MELGMIGLGKMGAFMAQRSLKFGHRIVGLNHSPEITKKLAAESGLVATFSQAEMIAKLSAPRFVWVMVPSGAATEEVIGQLKDLLEPGDTIIDGGNTYYKDDIRRAAALKEKQLNYVDAGTSGGIWGLKEGYSLMVGGETMSWTNFDQCLKVWLQPPIKAGAMLVRWGRDIL